MRNSDTSPLTPSLLRELAAAKPPCVSVVVQTGGNPRARLENAMREVEAKFTQADSTLPKEVFEPFHASLSTLGDTLNPTSQSLVLLSSPECNYRFESAAPLRENITVGPEFDLRGLLSLLSRKAEFYMLALSQNHLRLLHCTESDSGEVGLPPSVPKDFNQSRQTRQPDHMLDGRAAGGKNVGTHGISFGTSSDHDDKYEFLLNYYKMIDRGVNELLGGGEVPLVVVGVEHELALYHRVNTYRFMIEPGVHGAPDGLKGGEMHKRALELVLATPTPSVKHALDRFEKSAGSGHASSHAQEIVRAAYEGRVSHLFLQENAEYSGVFDEIRHRVKRHDVSPAAPVDLLNEAVVQTLLHGGDACVLPGRLMPNGVPVCAVLRYASPELQAEAGVTTTRG